ncbi:coiled-coil protein isoform X2 [Wolffia australiana]
MNYHGLDKYSDNLAEKLVCLHEQIAERQKIVESQIIQENLLREALNTKSCEVEDVENELQILKYISEIAHRDAQRAQMFNSDLGRIIDARRNSFLELKSQWMKFCEFFEDRRRLIEQELFGGEPDQEQKLHQLKGIGFEMGIVLSELQKSEEEHTRLAQEVENQPKVPSRSSYVERITEITKNSRKLDLDIEKIVEDTRELQKESNAISERLNRVYSVLNESLLREVTRQPQSDPDAIMLENERLEQQIKRR